MLMFSDIAEIYEDNGAAALSVLTDMEFFEWLPSLPFIPSPVKSDIPVLRKDFIIDPLQVLEARLSEADGILLMVSSAQRSLCRRSGATD